MLLTLYFTFHPIPNKSQCFTLGTTPKDRQIQIFTWRVSSIDSQSIATLQSQVIRGIVSKEETRLVQIYQLTRSCTVLIMRILSLKKYSIPTTEGKMMENYPSQISDEEVKSEFGFIGKEEF